MGGSLLRRLNITWLGFLSLGRLQYNFMMPLDELLMLHKRLLKWSPLK